MPENQGKAFDPKIPVNDREKLVKWADEQLDKSHGLPEREVYLNVAFMLGHQWVEWDDRGRRLESPRVRRNDPNAPVRITVNKIGALVERTVSRLTKSAPVPECRPVSDEDNDIASAKVGSRILTHELNRVGWEKLLTSLYFWVVPLGWSFLHIYWDPTQGDLIGEDEDGERVYTGETQVTAVPGTELRVDPDARTWDEARWCIRTTALTRAAIWEAYGVTDVDGEAKVSRTLSDDLFALADGAPATGHGAQSRERTKTERIQVHQLWLKPGSRSHPNGLVLTWTGSTVLEFMEEFPYDHGELPFVPFSLLPGMGNPEGRTWVGDLRGMQRDYNDARSREATIRRTLVPKLLAARGQIDAARLTTRVEVIDYAPTGPEPKWQMPDGRWMAQFQAGMERSDMEMGDRAGQAEVSQGRAPAGAPAAAILALQEADETKLAASAKELAWSVERTGHMLLMLARQFWEEERLVRAWSEDNRLEVVRFIGSDLPNQLDVHVSSESMLPKSKSARAQLGLDLFDRGVIRDPAQLMRMIEIPGVGFLQEEFDKSARQAEREFSKIMLGEFVKPEDWHEHPIHIAKHKSDMMSEEYENAPPEVKAAMGQHLREHYMWMQYQSMGVLPAGMAGGGLPGPAGGGGEEGVEGGGGGEQAAYTDPQTGLPPDPLAVAAGQAPSALSHNPPGSLIGGPGNPGSVPGQDPDSQNARMGN